jgi:hypothetical protein
VLQDQAFKPFRIGRFGEMFVKARFEGCLHIRILAVSA